MSQSAGLTVRWVDHVRLGLLFNSNIGKFMKFYSLNRKLHLWGSIITGIPIFIVIVTGIFIQVRRQVDWIQPPTQKTKTKYDVRITYDQIIQNAKSAPQMSVSGWEDIYLLDLRPNKGIVKVRTNTRWEAQMDLVTGQTIQVMKRHNDWLTLIHEGVWATPFNVDEGINLRHNVFLLANIVFTFLLVSGFWMLLKPIRREVKNLFSKKRTKLNWKKLNRQMHYWLSLPLMIPLFIVIISGMFLQVRHLSTWVYPKHETRPGKIPLADFSQILDSAKNVSEVPIKKWKDVDRLYVYPSKGIATIRTKAWYEKFEIVFDHQTAEILQVVRRRTDFIEDIHEGRFLNLNKNISMWIFLPAAIFALILWLTGTVMGVQHLINYSKKKKRTEI